MLARCLNLSPSERLQVNLLVDNAFKEAISYEFNKRLVYLKKLSCHLPVRLMEFIKEFQVSINDEDRLCLISNLIVNQQAQTPLYISSKGSFSVDDFLMCIISSVLGEVFAWEEEQNSRIVHDIAPLKEHEYAQESTGSAQYIYWHTEDAFHEFSSDYLVIGCIKNPNQVATTYCSINTLDLSAPIFDTLFEQRFMFKKVNSHKSTSRDSYKRSVLYGSRAKPFIRIDYYLMTALDLEAKKALETLVEYVNNSLKRVILNPGDILLIDNAMCIHGRESFNANYDGNDRWLKKVNITRDIYKSRNRQSDILSRVLR